MSKLRENLISACETLDTSKISVVLEEGVDINERGEYGDSVLSEVAYEIYRYDKNLRRYEIIKLLLDNGADPKILDEERIGPLHGPMWEMDGKMIELLCGYGADPNEEWGDSERESFYSLAEFDYRFEVYDLKLPEDPTKEGEKDEESWLAFLQRLAEKSSQRRKETKTLLSGISFTRLSRSKYALGYKNLSPTNGGDKK